MVAIRFLDSGPGGPTRPSPGPAAVPIRLTPQGAHPTVQKSITGIGGPPAHRAARRRAGGLLGNTGIAGIAALRSVRTRSISPENFDGSPGGGGRATDGTGARAARDLGPGWKISPSVTIRGTS